ncbi:MAG: hypothetical protein ROZ64_13680 [Burkholderiaceae bacterium]|nr:hypothetical protein [Burkholderiaceae bacterium]
MRMIAGRGSCNESNLRLDAEGVGRRSLELLRAIDQTVSSLRIDCELMSNLAHISNDLSERLKAKAVAGQLSLVDESGAIVETLNNAADAAESLHESLGRRCASARADHRLEPDDGVTDEYEAAISACADMHNALRDLADTVAELDAELEAPTGKSFTNIDELMAALRN